MRICVIHATAGAGHKKAAEGIYHGIKAQGVDAQLVDALDYTNSFFKRTYPDTYAFMVTKVPFVWAFFFALLNIPLMQPLVKVVRRIYNGLNAGRLQRFLIEQKFDVIITTQFLSAEVSAYLKRTGQITSKVICVVTDFDVHRIWVNQGIDLYCGASDFTREKLISLGVAPDKAFVTGIPTDQVFGHPADKNAMRAKLGLAQDQFTVLLATGSFGMGPIEELIESLNSFQVVVVCGHNKGLYARLQGKASTHVHVLGLVNNMHELMSAADVMVTKPGGLSVAEALVKHLPMIFFSVIPGQEEGNVAVLKKYGAGMDQMDLPQIAACVRQWHANPALLTDLKKNIAALAKPNAVADIVRLALSS